MIFYQDILGNLSISYLIYSMSALSFYHSNSLYFGAFITILCSISELLPRICLSLASILHTLSIITVTMILILMLDCTCFLNHCIFITNEHSHLLSSLFVTSSQGNLFDAILIYLLVFLFEPLLQL